METIACVAVPHTGLQYSSCSRLCCRPCRPRLSRCVRWRHCSAAAATLNVSAQQSSAEDLQMQLETLMEEAKEARDRATKARSRFMRLTEAVEQLSLRAAAEMKAGNEAAARLLLVEKRNVMFALQVSRRRAEVLEELATKLNEVMSKKETSLIASLAWATNVEKSKETSDVRIVSPSPKESGDTDAELELLRREQEVATSDADNAVSIKDVSFEAYLQEVDGSIGEIEDKLQSFLEVAFMLTRMDERVVLVRQLLGDLRLARSRIKKVQ